MANPSAPVVPQNLEAEEAVIGSLLIDPDAIYALREAGLEAREFYREVHGIIYSAACALTDRREPVDIVTLAAEIGERVQDAPVIMAGLIGQTPTSVHAAHYAELVRRAAAQRRLIAVAGEIARLAHEHEGPVDGLYDQASQAFMAAVNVSEPASHLTGSNETLLRYLAEQQARADWLQENPGGLLHVGLHSLDRLLGDLQPGFLSVIAAETSVGKTILMEQVAEYNARRGHPVVFYHLELTHQFMLHRLMARYSLPAVSVAQLREGYAGQGVSQAIDTVRQWFPRITYVHCPGWTAERIAADIQRLVAQGRCELAVIDYLQMMPLPQVKGLNSAMLIGQQAAALKICAERAGIPIVLGSQVNRSNTHENRRPSKDDIRNSGEVVERANQVIVLHRPTKREDQDANAKAEWIEAYVDKNTQGATGMCKLIHVLGRYLFAEEQHG